MNPFLKRELTEQDIDILSLTCCEKNCPWEDDRQLPRGVGRGESPRQPPLEKKKQRFKEYRKTNRGWIFSLIQS